MAINRINSLWLWVFLLASCKAAPDLKSITVTPVDQEVTVYSNVIQYTATGNYSDDSTKDLTQEVSWSVDSTADTLFSSSIKGLLTPSRLGTFILLATPVAGDTSSDVVGYTTLRIKN